jgi:serine/threonine-protein kinase
MLAAPDYPRAFEAGNNRLGEMICPSCQAQNEDAAEACFTCGRALFAVTHGIVLSARYEVLRPLGAGGMGRVYKAHDRVLDEDVAIKVLRPEFTRDPEMTRRFRSEIKLARKVSHRNVCRIHEYGEDGRLCFFSMEHIEGVNLKDYLAAHTLSRDDAYDVVLQIAQGLRAVHEHGIIHRDFKASNIMVDGHGIVKLMDFGIAKEATADTTGITGSSVIGTPEYMSPEQGSGGKVDFRSDVYSLGCFVYEIFAGQPPFRGDTPLATLYKHQQEPPPLDAERLSIPLVEVLHRALAKDPAARYQTVASFVDALHAAQEADLTGVVQSALATTTIPTPIRTTPRAGASRTSSARQLGLWGALATIVVLVVAATGVGSFWRGPTTAPPASEASPSLVTGQSSPSTTPGDASNAPATTPREASLTSAPTHPTGSSATPEPVAPSEAPPSPQATPPETAPAATSKTREERGSLTLLIVPEAEVTVDEQSIGRVSMRELTLAPGPHVVRVLHPDYEPLQRKLTIRAGVASKLVLDLAEKGIRKTQ